MSHAPKNELSPPGWAATLLELVLPRGTAGASVKADLDEEFRELAGRVRPTRARIWYMWETVKLAAHFAWSALRSDTSRERGGMGMDGTKLNLRLALRQFGRAPAFMFTAVATIALGIGANVAIFSVVNAVLLDPLPYDRPDELVAIWEWNVPRDRTNNVANPGNFSAWRDGSDAFSRMTAISMVQPATVSAAGEPNEAMVQYASPDFFSVLGLEALTGRTFNADLSAVETTEAVISDRYWRDQFGGSPDVVGRTLQLNGNPVVVVGVMPPEYVVFGEGTDLWAAIRIDEGDQTNSGRWLMVLGRLAPGATIEAADAELKAVSAALQVEFPTFNAGWSVNLVPLEEEVVGDVKRLLWMLLGAVGLLLLIASANVANLFLVRATARQREMAVRTSLGASGRTLAGQLLTESLLIAGAGAGLGIVGAQVATRWMATTMPDAFALPRVEGAGVDGSVLAFAAFVTVGTALLFGLLPALKAARTSPAGILGAESRGPSRRTGRVRDLLVIGEVGLSMILLAGAALFARSFVTLMQVDDGIETERVLVARVNLSGSTYAGDESKIAFFEELLGGLSARGDVEAVGGITFLPMDGLGAGTSYWVTDRPAPEPEDRRAADIRNVAGDYFGAMGIELLRGRLFDSRDGIGAPQTIVVNRSLATRYWPDAPAVGKRVVVNWLDETPWEVIGVVEDVRTSGPEVEPREVIYINYSMHTFFPWLQLAVRGSGDPEALTSTVRAELSAIDETLPLGNPRVMEDIVGRSVARPRMTSALMLIFATMATLLAAVGLYGVLAYTVSRRVREIGVRVALGAEPGRVVRLVAAQGSRLVLIGLAIGTVGALIGNRFIAALLYEVAPSDPFSLGLAGAVLAFVAVLACTVPAWRASRVAPAEALRPD